MAAPLDDAALAGALAREAGQLAATMRARGVGARRKTSVSDLVTDADHAAEKLIFERLAAARPEDGVLGEEGTSVAGERTWVVDPVDGTFNFLCGLAEWCTALALTDGDGPVLAAIYQPARDELWLGGRDVAASCNGVPLGPLAARPLAEVSIATYLHPPAVPDDALRIPLLRAVAGAAVVRMLGSGSLELAAVAAGRLGAWLHPQTPDWDWLPGATLVRAAGGVAEVFEAGGRRWHVAANRQAADEIVDLVGGA
jgi:fructose-1,6-bisphosphatase/inositol monophosphatase family enzyme